jgi:hypothetical protein
MEKSPRRNQISAKNAIDQPMVTEGEMHLHHMALAGEPRLRVVFADRSIALGLPIGATLGDVAEWVNDVTRSHNDALVAIDIRMAVSPGLTACDAAH